MGKMKFPRLGEILGIPLKIINFFKAFIVSDTKWQNVDTQM